MRHKNKMFACFQMMSCFRIVRIIWTGGPRSFLFELDLLVLNFYRPVVCYIDLGLVLYAGRVHLMFHVW